MAFLQVNLMSTALMRTVPVNVILPVDKPKVPGQAKREEKPYKTLYLLHGVIGSYVDWVNGTRIQRFAEDNNLAVVMPAGENSFYVDHEGGAANYGEFVGKELVELTRRMFPLSRKREDTFIGGLSMGGYGALRNGLKYHDTFGFIVALSSAIITEEYNQRPYGLKGMFFETREFAEKCFGDLSKLTKSDKDPRYLVKELKKKNIIFPKIYMACGEDDFLFAKNNDFVEFLKENDIEVTYDIGPGAHEWDFWDTYIKRAIEWLPLEQTQAGLGSGNIGNK